MRRSAPYNALSDASKKSDTSNRIDLGNARAGSKGMAYGLDEYNDNIPLNQIAVRRDIDVDQTRRGA